MYKKVLLLGFLVFSALASAQCPNVELLLSTQAEVDDFSINYPNCTLLTNKLVVESLGGDVISNLDGLSAIVFAPHLVIKDTEITDYSGLSALEEVTHLTLWSNNEVVSLAGFSSLTTANRFELFFNNGMIDLSGAPNLSTMDFITFFGNSSLQDISDLSFITQLLKLTIGGNNLNDLSGLENLESVFGDILLSNEQVSHLDELANLQNISGSLYLSSNPNLVDISALSNIQSVFDLYVVESPLLGNLAGLENVISISGELRIGYNTSLVDLSVFSSLVVVGDLEIYENENLVSLNGLENLTQIDRTLSILNNSSLIDILSLDNVSPFAVDAFVIANNGSLSVCDSELICALIAASNVVKTVQNNAPDCNTIQEVENMCLLGVEDNVLNAQVVLSPNPVIDLFQVHSPNDLLIKSIGLYSVTGHKIHSSKTATMDVSMLSSGVYFVRIEAEQGTIVKRLIKH